MPVMDGYDTIRAIRTIDAVQDAPDHRRHRQGRRPASASAASMPAPTTTSRSRSTPPSCSPLSGRGCRPRSRPHERPCRLVERPRADERRRPRRPRPGRRRQRREAAGAEGGAGCRSAIRSSRPTPGLAALRCVMAQDFAVILLDVRMPIMDGFETAALIRQRRQSEMTPIIFITAYGSDEIVDTDLYAEGAVDFIFAPVPPNELRAKVSVFANLFIKAEELASAGPGGAGVRRPAAAPHRRRARSASSRPTPRTATCTPTRAGPRSPASRREEAIGQRVGHHHRLRGARRARSPSCPATRCPGRAPPSLRDPASGLGVTDRARDLEVDPGQRRRIAGWVGTLADVTAVPREREAEQARRAAEERYRRIVETTMEGIWLLDADNRTTFVNEALARMLADDRRRDAGSAEPRLLLRRRGLRAMQGGPRPPARGRQRAARDEASQRRRHRDVRRS